MKAVAVIVGDTVSGTIRFSQEKEGTPLHIEGSVKGLKDGKHGFHIHQFGDVTNGCTSAGPHFNPFGKTHGAKEDSERHAGDFGNIVSKDGVAEINFDDNVAELFGKHTIIGRCMVVHEGVDDLGKGGDEESKKTGNAGKRLGCGIIGVSQ